MPLPKSACKALRNVRSCPVAQVSPAIIIPPAGLCRPHSKRIGSVAGTCARGTQRVYAATLPAQPAGEATSQPADDRDPPTLTRSSVPNGHLQKLRKAAAKAIFEFPITWVYMFSYLSFMLLIPILALLVRASQIPLDVFIARATEPIAMHAYYVTFTMAVAASIVNAVFGFILAWVLVKYKFPGRRLLDAAVDLPFALPTSVAGLTLISVYSEEGLLGAFLTRIGINVVFSKLGVVVAMIFVSFPFVVRTMQPVLQEMEKEQIEAAWSLGASPWKTFLEIIFPPLIPALLTGTALAFSRAIGEFGSIVIISSNFAFKDLIAPVLIFQCLEQYDFVGATVIGTVMLLTSLAIMLLVNWLQGLSQQYRK